MPTTSPVFYVHQWFLLMLYSNFQMRVAEAGIASLKTIHGEMYTAGTPPDLLCK